MNNRFLLPDLVRFILDTTEGLNKKEVETFVRAYFTVIEKALFEEDFVKINDLGKFSLQKVEARKSINVNTGEAFEIKAHYKLTFVPDAKLREIANKPFEHLEAIELENEQEPIKKETINLNKPTTKEDNIMEKKEKTVFVVTDKPTANEKKTAPETQKAKKGKLVAWIVFVVVMCALIVFALWKTVFTGPEIEPTITEEIVESAPVAPVVEEVTPPLPKWSIRPIGKHSKWFLCKKESALLYLPWNTTGIKFFGFIFTKRTGHISRIPTRFLPEPRFVFPNLIRP